MKAEFAKEITKRTEVYYFCELCLDVHPIKKCSFHNKNDLYRHLRHKHTDEDFEKYKRFYMRTKPSKPKPKKKPKAKPKPKKSTPKKKTAKKKKK